MLKFREEKIEYRLVTLAVLASAFFFICKIVYAGIIELPYPKEILEPANIALTNLFIEGKNPYVLSALEWEVPAINYDYPPLNSLLAAAIAVITGCGAVNAHFIISLTSILASAVIGAMTVNRYSNTTVAPAIASLLFMFCHWRFGYISAAPDDLGLLLFLLTMYAATSPKVRNKPLICALGITLCFYTKQYLIFIAPGLFIYMFLYSKKEAIKLLVWTAAINVILAVIITYTMPLYWTKVLYFTYIGAGLGGGAKIATLLEQLRYLIFPFAGLFAVLIFAASMTVAKMRRSNKKLSSIKIAENDAQALHIVQMVVMTLPLVVIGRNDGAFLSYFLQLWMPSVILVTLTSIEKMKPDKHETVYMIIYGLIALFTIYFGYGKLPLHILSDEDIADWEKAYGYVETYSEKGDIFYAAPLTYEGFERKNGEWICGHDGEMFYFDPEHTSETEVAKTNLFPYAEEIALNTVAFHEQIAQKAEKRQYALITIVGEGTYYIFDKPICERMGYERIDKLELWVGNMPYEVSFFALKSEE